MCTLTALLAAVFTNSSVEDICKAIDEEYQVAEARQSLSLAEQLEEPVSGFNIWIQSQTRTKLLFLVPTVPMS